MLKTVCVKAPCSDNSKNIFEQQKRHCALFRADSNEGDVFFVYALRLYPTHAQKRLRITFHSGFQQLLNYILLQMRMSRDMTCACCSIS